MVEHVHCIVKVCKKKKSLIVIPRTARSHRAPRSNSWWGEAGLHLKISQQLTGRHSLASRGGGKQQSNGRVKVIRQMFM